MSYGLKAKHVKTKKLVKNTNAFYKAIQANKFINEDEYYQTNTKIIQKYAHIIECLYNDYTCWLFMYVDFQRMKFSYFSRKKT